MADPNKVDPIHQFQITDIVSFGDGGLSFTNSALFKLHVQYPTAEQELLMVSRHREHLAQGMSVDESIARTVATAGA